jgi:RNA-directed DNA polymerase
MVDESARYVKGWHGYFAYCETPMVLRGLVSWMRRRLRCVVWNQWKRGPRRFAELSKRAVGKDLAASSAGSAHGPWRRSRSPALSFALPNAYFNSLGLPTLAARMGR